MHLSTLLAFAALSLFGAVGHATAAETSTTLSNEVSSPDEYPVITAAEVSGLGGDLTVRAYGIKHLYETMVISYFTLVCQHRYVI
ncbi:MULTISPECIES: hypothetical protein [Vibrio]|uniref:Uncharacterized protein n=1 Tax=Vibrio metschnikovii TaxID=28172 RepID=A0A9X0R9F8_VIBME|nr:MULTISPECIES: hypothetical protein [Vibrio]MBC5850901.1 hypothetical protein [Vibrio metschnikovii]PXA74571.1 hypothetical protein DMC15_00815 [Vibrio sp. 11986-1-5]